MTAVATDITPHPAKWSAPLLETISVLLDDAGADSTWTILDPFAGVGLTRLSECCPAATWVGIELEPEWAVSDPRTRVGSALDLPWEHPTFSAVITSPVFGNRMSDHHDAKDDSDRITYRHRLGRELTTGSAAALNWGRDYRQMHEAAWAEALRVSLPGALWIVNVGNHIRGGIEQRVTEWHLGHLMSLGFTVEQVVKVATRKQRKGANGQLRTDGERLLVLRAPAKSGGML